MGIFRNITKTLKKAAPLIGSAIGMYFGGPLGASIGSGIGSLAAGRSAEEALRNAALTGVTTYAMGGKDFGREFDFSTEGSPFASPQALGPGEFADTNALTSIKSAGTDSIFSKLIPESTMGKIALGGGILGLAGGLGEEQQTGGFKMRPDPVGRTRLGTGRIGNKLYNLDDPDERRQYFEDNRRRRGELEMNEGGIAEIDMKLPDLNDTRTFAEKMTTGQLKFNTRAGKAGYTEAEIRQIQNELDKRLAPKAPMMPMASVGDPSQLMRNFMVGGEVTGPGTGTSDSVPARLSDGEFVVTAKAVRGAGGGDRNVGAARMYDMMSNLERVA